MALLEKWWVRLLISILIAGGVTLGFNPRSVDAFGFSTLLLTGTFYIGLSFVYGASSHNRNKQNPSRDSDEILDES